MNYLALVNRARQEAGASGAAYTSLTGLSAEGQRFKDWINQAFTDIQDHKPDWQWMRKSFQFNTVAGTSNYTPTAAGVTDLKDWKRDSFRCSTASASFADEQVLPFMAYETFRDVWQFGNMRTSQARPACFTVNPNKSLTFGAIPDNVYTIVGEYYRLPVNLVNDTDDPSASGFDLPSHYHMLIVFKALQSYALYESAPEVQVRADAEVKRLLKRLEFDFMPLLVNGPPLA